MPLPLAVFPACNFPLIIWSPTLSPCNHVYHIFKTLDNMPCIWWNEMNSLKNIYHREFDSFTMPLDFFSCVFFNREKLSINEFILQIILFSYFLFMMFWKFSDCSCLAEDLTSGRKWMVMRSSSTTSFMWTLLSASIVFYSKILIEYSLLSIPCPYA